MTQIDKKCGWRWLVVYSLILLTRCGTLPNGQRWGQEATLRPGWRRVGTAAVDAALSPRVWVPAVGGGAFLIGDELGNIDHKLSDWAATHTPVFGSQKRAEQISDYLVYTAGVAASLTALATPSGAMPAAWKEGQAAEEWEWLAAKGKAMLGVDGGAVLLTHATNSWFLKNITHRPRPYTSDPAEAAMHDPAEANKSFPSGHTSTTAVLTTLASRNVEYFPWPKEGRTALQYGLIGLTLSTAWARVEAHQHFPSDVLVGAAIGNFFGAFINDAFLGLHRPHEGGVTIQPTRDGVMLGLRWPW